MHERGTCAHGRYLALYVLPTEQACSRLGIAASRRIGTAVRRNRAKRVVRAIFRDHKPRRAVDVVCVVKPPIVGAEFGSIAADYQATLRRALSSRRHEAASGPR